MKTNPKAEGDHANNVVRLGKHAPMRHAAAAAQAPEQLAIDFDVPHRLLVLAAERLHGATFFHWLLEARPRIVLDLRFAPHFSFKTIDGTTVRRRIEAAGSFYVRDPTPFHEYAPSLLRHDPRTIALKLPDHALAVGIPASPMMVLVKEDAVARAMAPYLVGALRERLGGSWSPCIVT